MAASGMGIVAPAQDEKRGTDRRELAILDGGIVEPESRVLDTVNTALILGSDLDAANPSGETALHVASAQGYETAVRALAERGANLNARNARELGCNDGASGAISTRHGVLSSSPQRRNGIPLAPLHVHCLRSTLADARQRR
jgi:Ankyrin repeat